MDSMHVKLGRDLYTGIGHRPFPAGAEIHLEKGLAQGLIDVGHAEKSAQQIAAEKAAEAAQAQQAAHEAAEEAEHQNHD